MACPRRDAIKERLPLPRIGYVVRLGLELSGGPSQEHKAHITHNEIRRPVRTRPGSVDKTRVNPRVIGSVAMATSRYNRPYPKAASNRAVLWKGRPPPSL